MVYEKYDNFIHLLYSKLSIEDKTAISLTTIDTTNAYSDLPSEASTATGEHVVRYFSGLTQHKKALREHSSSHPHFKNAIKCVLQAQIRVVLPLTNLNGEMKAAHSTILLQLVEEYTECFACILTFPEEIFATLKDGDKQFHIAAVVATHTRIAAEEKSSVNRCIVTANHYKLRMIFNMMNLPTTPLNTRVEAVQDLWKELMRHYAGFFAEIYPELDKKVVEKGERLYVDEFIIIAADLALVTLPFTIGCLNPPLSTPSGLYLPPQVCRGEDSIRAALSDCVFTGMRVEEIPVQLRHSAATCPDQHPPRQQRAHIRPALAARHQSGTA